MVSETKFGVISDIHGDREALEHAAGFCAEEGVDALLICGDLSGSYCSLQARKRFDDALREVCIQHVDANVEGPARGTNKAYTKAAREIFIALKNDDNLSRYEGWQELVDAKAAFLADMKSFVEQDYRCVKAILDSTGVRYFIVPGNHDVDGIAEAVFGGAYLHKGRAEVKNLVLRGYGGSLDCEGKPEYHPHFIPFSLLGEKCCPFSAKEQEHSVGFSLDDIVRPSDIIVSHMPPRGILDRSAMGVHSGSSVLRDLIGRGGPKLLVCGHIHEAVGAVKANATVVYNAGGVSSMVHNYFTGNPQRFVGASGHFGVVGLGNKISVSRYDIGLKPNGWSVGFVEKESF